VRVSFTLHGIPVSRGIAIGRAYLIAPAALDVDHYLVEPAQIEGEVERFRSAQQLVHQELDVLRNDLAADAPSEMGAFINVHSMILNDAMLVQETIDLIRTRRYNVEWALTEQLERLSRHFRRHRRRIPARAESRHPAGGRTRAEGVGGGNGRQPRR
jgi:phosphotransferase system enzyme I (PtsI)